MTHSPEALHLQTGMDLRSFLITLWDRQGRPLLHVSKGNHSILHF